jgi:type I restriction enzyme M protein
MNVSQFKAWVRFMLFLNSISDRYADSEDSAPPVAIPVRWIGP